MKKLICILLSIVILLCAGITVFAETKTDQTTTETTTTTESTTETTETTTTTELTTETTETTTTTELTTETTETTTPTEPSTPPCTKHVFEYTVPIVATCTTEGKIIAKCQNDGCAVEYEYIVPATHQYSNWTENSELDSNGNKIESAICTKCYNTFTRVKECEPDKHIWGEVVKENQLNATCTSHATHEEVISCTKCNKELSRKLIVDENSALGHNLFFSESVENSLECTRENCGFSTEITEIINITINENRHNIFFINDDTSALKYTITFKCRDYDKEISVESDEVTLYIPNEPTNPDNVTALNNEATPVNIDTTTAGEKYYKVFFKGVEFTKGIKVTVKTPEIYVKLGKNLLDNESFEYIKKNGLTFSITNNTEDEILCECDNDNLKVTTQKNGKIFVEPKEYYVMNPEEIEDYYIKFYFNRNGTEYSKKIYLYYSVTSLECNGTKYYTQDQNIKKATIYYIENYFDEKKETTITFKPDTSKVGKQTYDTGYYGDFTYYVKCKAPTVKTTAGTKAVTVKWNKIDGATGYQVYRSTSKNSGYKLVKTISGGSKVSFKNTGLKSKQTYYYKVVAVYKSNKNCNSKYSNIVSCKTK